MPAPDPIGIQYPTGFDKLTYAKVNQALAPHANAQSAQTWRVFAAAWNGIAYRLRGAQEHCARLSESLRKSSAPAPEERYVQEAALFSFYASLASALECFYLAAYCAGSLRRPALLPASKPGHLSKYSKDVVDAFNRQFAGDPISVALDNPLSNKWWLPLFEFRNALMHRGSLPRQHFFTNVPAMERPSAVPSNPKALSDDWSYDVDLDPSTFEALYADVLATINALVTALESFLDRHA